MAYRQPGYASTSHLVNRAALLGQQQQGDLQVRVDMGQDLDGEVQSLHDKVARLKRLAGDLDDETKLRRTMVEELEAGFLRAQASMRETMRRMNKLYSEGITGGNHMIVLLVLAFIMVLGVYAMLRGYRFLSWLF